MKLALAISFAALALSACATASITHSELDKGELLLKGQFTEIGQMQYFYGDQRSTGLFTFDAHRISTPLTLIGNCHGVEANAAQYLIVAAPLEAPSEIIESEYARDKKVVASATHWLRACTRIDPVKSSGLLPEKTYTGLIESIEPSSGYDQGFTSMETDFGTIVFGGICEGINVGERVKAALGWSRPYDDPLAENWKLISCEPSPKAAT